MISQQQADSKIQTIHDFREACLRNDFLVPALKNPLCNRMFLQEVREGTTYVPKIKELKSALCVTPPTIAVIQQALIDCLQVGIDKMNQ